MCIQQKWIKNRYSNHSVLVKCGHCPACQQEKANKRTARLKNTLEKGEIALFLTLTYTNESIPYIKRSDLQKAIDAYYSNLDNRFNFTYDINIYRDFQPRLVRAGSSYDVKVCNQECKEAVETVTLNENDFKHLYLNQFKDLKNKPNCIGVCYYPDLQKFFKRLRINLNRNYGYTRSFRSFQVSELGSHSARPHFHALLFIPAQEENTFRAAFFKSWPFADMRVNFRAIEVARDAASYVASYVNRGSDFPKLFEKSIFRPKCSYSQDTGLANEHFRLSSLLEKIRNRNLTYPCKVFEGTATKDVDIPLPKYVINRYFPRFKGFSRLTTSEALDILREPQRYARYARILDLDLDDIHGTKVMLSNSYARFCSELGLEPNRLSLEKYVSSFVECHKVRSMNNLAAWYRNDLNEPLLLQFDNWYEVAVHPDDYSLLTIDRMLRYSDLNLNLLSYDNPNTFPLNVIRTSNLQDLYFKKSKIRHVTNFVMSRSFDV